MAATPRLDTATAANLAVVLNSPSARQALLHAENARTEQRRSIIAAMLADERAPLQEAEERARIEADLAPRVALAQQALNDLAAQSRAANIAGQQAQARAERVRNNALVTLLGLGGAAITEALSEVRHAQRESLALIEFRPAPNLRDRWKRSASEVEPLHRKRAERMAELATSLQRLEFAADVTPAEIERQCEAAIAEVQSTKPETMPRGQLVVPAA